MKFSSKRYAFKWLLLIVLIAAFTFNFAGRIPQEQPAPDNDAEEGRTYTTPKVEEWLFTDNVIWLDEIADDELWSLE